MGKYYDKYYFVISHGKEASLFSSGSLPNDSTSMLALKHVQTLALKQSIVDVNITDNGQFATAQDGVGFATFNLEIMKLTTAQHPWKFFGAAEAQVSRRLYVVGCERRQASHI